MTVYVVVVEQHYASYVRFDTVFSTREKAQEYIKEQRVPDAVIYEAIVDSGEPSC